MRASATARRGWKDKSRTGQLRHGLRLSALVPAAAPRRSARQSDENAPPAHGKAAGGIGAWADLPALPGALQTARRASPAAGHATACRQRPEGVERPRRGGSLSSPAFSVMGTAPPSCRFSPCSVAVIVPSVISSLCLQPSEATRNSSQASPLFSVPS